MALGGHGAEQAYAFTPFAPAPGQVAQRQAVCIGAGLFHIRSAGGGAAAVGQKLGGTGNIAGRAALQALAAPEQGNDLGPVCLELLCVHGMVQAYHLFGRAGVGRVQRMGGGGVQHGGKGPGQDHAVEAVGIGGTMDALHRVARFLGDAAHHGAFAAAGPAFDEIQLNARFCAELLKIATEAPGADRA